MKGEYKENLITQENKSLWINFVTSIQWANMCPLKIPGETSYMDGHTIIYKKSESWNNIIVCSHFWEYNQYGYVALDISGKRIHQNVNDHNDDDRKNDENICPCHGQLARG